MKYPRMLTTLLTTSLLISAWPVITLAQERNEDSSYLIEEIVVTARRREENLRDVPGTVTALTAATLESAGVRRASDFIALTPGRFEFLLELQNFIHLLLVEVSPVDTYLADGLVLH